MQSSLPRCFSPGVTPHASCPYSLIMIGELNTSRLAPYSAEDLSFLPGGAALSGACRLEDGPRYPSDYQRREMTPAPGTMVTDWSSWAGAVMKPGRLQRESPVMELSPAIYSG